MEEEIREELSGTFLEKAPVVRVSAATGEGLPHLIEVIEKMAREEVEEKDTSTIPRLPIDRAFSLSGFGTIITGTLLSGTITKEDTLEMYPIGKTSKIRSIQVHGQDVDRCFAGQRVAINLSNIKKREIGRGCVLAPPDSMKNTDLLDVKMNILDSSMRVLTNHTRLHLFTGTSEILCRAVLLDQDELGPGESGYVQLRLEEEIAVKKGDKFVVRFYSPMETIGGGVILEPNPSVHRRHQQQVIEDLERRESGSSADVVELHVKSHAETMVTLSEIARLTALSAEEVEADAAQLAAEGTVLLFPMKKETWAWHRQDVARARETILAALTEYEKKYPYRYGMKKAEVHSNFFRRIRPNVFDLFLAYLEEEGALKRVDEFLCTPDYQVRKDALYERVSAALLGAMEKAGFDFVRYGEIPVKDVKQEVEDDILNILLEEKKIVKVTDEMYTLSAYMDEAKEKIRASLAEDPVITIAQVRDMFQTSRKSAKPILEYMDSIKVTKKTGAESERVAY